MQKKYLKFVWILVILIPSTLFFLFRQDIHNYIGNSEPASSAAVATKLLYTDPQYGFSFEYPNNLAVEKTTTSLIIRKENNHYAEFIFPERYIGEPSDPNLDFGGYATYFAKALCDASGPTGNTYCDKVDSITIIENPSGLTILKVILHEVTEKYGQEEVGRIRVPIYAIDVKNNHLAETKLILLVPSENAKDDYQIETLESILKSFAF